MPNGDFTRLLRQLSQNPDNMGSSDLAARNTNILTKWANMGSVAADPDSYSQRLGDPEYADLLRDNPSYVERTTEDYVNRNARDFLPYFQNVPKEHYDAIFNNLKDNLYKMYPNAAEKDQAERTPEGIKFWDSLRALGRARNMMSGDK